MSSAVHKQRHAQARQVCATELKSGQTKTRRRREKLKGNRERGREGDDDTQTTREEASGLGNGTWRSLRMCVGRLVYNDEGVGPYERNVSRVVQTLLEQGHFNSGAFLTFEH